MPDPVFDIVFLVIGRTVRSDLGSRWDERFGVLCYGIRKDFGGLCVIYITSMKMLATGRPKQHLYGTDGLTGRNEFEERPFDIVRLALELFVVSDVEILLQAS